MECKNANLKSFTKIILECEVLKKPDMPINISKWPIEYNGYPTPVITLSDKK